MLKTKKQLLFNNAMNRYNQNKSYKYIYKVVAILNISMQSYLLYLLFLQNLNFFTVCIIFCIAYFLTDFINGYVHMYMDNNHRYDSFFGPFIASFHLHHRMPTYKNSSVIMIYFNESGPKFWLVPFLLFSIILYSLEINEYILTLLTFIGILSSVAEVSHFLCHNSNSKIVLFLQSIYILLPVKHHNNHHQKDNQSYAFLNGTSDFLLDKIAKKYYDGYKENSDLHFKLYDGADTTNRV